MSSLTYFYQGCPVCGRSLRVPVQYFGRAMSCSHCGGEFHAIGEAPSPARAAQLLSPMPTTDIQEWPLPDKIESAAIRAIH